jgi:hypothetical protein
LIASVILSSTIFSQSVTDTSKIVLPYPVAKQVAKDLIKGDSAVAVLNLKNDETLLLERKISLKDSIIYSYRLKETNYQNQVKNQEQKIEGWQKEYSTLQDDYKKLLTKHRFTKILAYAIVGGLGYLYISK